MTELLYREETDNDLILRKALGLPGVGGYVWDGKDLIPACPTCGHHPKIGAPPMRTGTPTDDVVPDRFAMATAARTVRLLVDVLDQRRPPRQVADLAAPRVLRYIAAAPTESGGLRGGVRLMTCRTAQPHEGAVEVAASIRMAGKRRALAASFSLVDFNRWLCTTIRIL
jgi:hypothetical protein